MTVSVNFYPGPVHRDEHRVARDFMISLKNFPDNSQ